MSNKGSVTRIAVSATLVVVILVYGFYDAMFSANVKIDAVTPATILKKETESNAEPAKEEKKTENTKAQETQTPKTDNKTTVTTSSNATVKGKVIEKFISPYSAKNSYNNVYLKNSTDLDIDIKSMLSQSLSYKIQKNGKPQVLIMHTHTTESFMTENRDYYTDEDLTRRTDENLNMVHLGNIVADKLNSLGIVTVHDKTVHDYPEYNNSYTRSAATVNSNLKKYPSIKIVIDMHRDAISANDTDKVKVTTEINGKKAAQIMLVMGSQSGSVTNFPNWKENLNLALKLQQTIEVMYPSLARPLSLMSRNYNESLTTGSMLIEMGTDGNTIDEVSYSAELLSNALASLLNTLG
ncbi:MAG: stage II sporulation protein P [Clostridia bacterium]|nr:stage II sporulation protein P [Clostridia bacterium]